jgi:hypothetical protein
MKYVITILLFVLLIYSGNIYSQTNDQTTLKEFWSLFKNAVAKEDFEAIKGLCRLPLVECYFSEYGQTTEDVQKYFIAYSPSEFENIKSQIQKITLPKIFTFYDNNAANKFYTNFNVNSGIEVYSVLIEGWHYSATDLFIVKIEGKYYIIGDDSWEYEG